MGKTSRWFRAFLGSKKSPPEHSSTPARPNKNSNANDRTRISGAYAASESEAIDPNKHAIAVAAATAAVAEAALAAAQAAAEVVRLTSGGGGRPPSTAAYERRRESAAVKIQSAFRAYLARRALRALKGLVRLQALVRGHIVRKQSADMLRRMQALARIQARACANRAHISESSRYLSKSSKPHNPGLANPKKYDNQLLANGTKSDQSLILKTQRSQSKSKIKETVDVERIPLGSNWLDRWMAECSWNTQGDTSLKTGHADDERSDKILEVDTWKPHLNSKQSDRIIGTPQHFTTRNYNDRGITPFNFLSRHSTKSQKQNPNISSGEVSSSLRSLKFPLEVDQAAVRTNNNSPQMYSASSRPGSSGRRGPFTPARSECSRSLFGDYVGYPNYMANTESSVAKFRSQSAPRQRMQVHEKLGSTKRYVHGFLDADTISERGLSLDANFKTKGYLGSSHLDRIGMPVQGNRAGGYNSSYGGKC